MCEKTREVEVGGGQPFGGETYNHEEDKDRLKAQLAAVRKYMFDAKGWRTLQEISDAVGAPMQSVSARLRDLRKAKFGGHTVVKRNLGGGLWIYAVLRPSDINTILGSRHGNE